LNKLICPECKSNNIQRKEIIEGLYRESLYKTDYDGNVLDIEPIYDEIKDFDTSTIVSYICGNCDYGNEPFNEDNLQEFKENDQ
jgi:hypothetical protein